MTERVVIDPASQLKIRTRARGLLSRLAHDLELEGTVEGEGTREGDAYEGAMTLRIDTIRVVGVLKQHTVDRDALSVSDQAEIERKIRHEVFRGEPEVVVKVKGEDVRVCFGERMTSVRPHIDFSSRDGATTIHTSFTISLRALGLAEVKGPLGAFSLKDDIEIEANIVVRPA